MNMKEKNTNIISMLDRGIQVIEELHRNKAPMGVSELSKSTHLSKATVYRILYTLEMNQYVVKDKVTEKYSLGVAFIKLGEYVKSTVNLNTIARPHMEALAKETGETAYLCQLYENTALVLETVSGESSALYSMVTPTIPLYCSALGRVLMASMTEEEAEKYIESSELEKRTINTKTSKSAVLAEVKCILKERISVEIEEYEYGMTCIAGPVYDGNGNIIASLSASGPSTRIDFKGREKIIEAVKNACKEISTKMEL